ncbi:MAG: pilin [Candidatus Pacebacteria bacterium]|nr:pilin [Candidatus Paceibacterota bacterium]
MSIIKKGKDAYAHTSFFVFGFLSVVALLLILGAVPSSASAATWCSKDSNNVVHVFSSGPACTQGRQSSWNICGTCTVWCAVGKDKKAVNAFPSNAACTGYINNSGVSGGLCRQCTATDITTINRKLLPYTSKTPSADFPSGSLFNLGIGGVSGSYGDTGIDLPLSILDQIPAGAGTGAGSSCEENKAYSIQQIQNALSAIDSQISAKTAQAKALAADTSDPDNINKANEIALVEVAQLQDSRNLVQSKMSELQAKDCSQTSPTPATNPNPPADPGADLFPKAGDGIDLTPKGGGGSCNGGGGLPNPLGSTCDLYTFFTKVLKVVEQLGGILVVLAIIYTGFLFVKAQGNSEELETAKRAFLWTVIGAGVLLGATVLSSIITNTINQLK